MAGHYFIKAVNQAQHRILQASVILAEIRPEVQNVEPIGTGILLYLACEYFLITAGHVLNHENWQRLVIPTSPIPSMGNPVHLQGEMVSSYINSATKGRKDFSILRFYPKMHKHLQSFNPITEDMIFMNHNVQEKDHYIFAGFPWRHIRRKGNAFHINPFTFLTSGTGKKRYRKHDFEEDLFALVKYQRRLQRLGDGGIFQARNPQGISGCGLYFIPAFNEAQLRFPRLYLIGIMIENYEDKGFMAAFKIDIIVEIIRNEFQLYGLSAPPTRAQADIGIVYQGDFWERVEAEEIARGITPVPEPGVNRILRQTPVMAQSSQASDINSPIN